MLSPLLQNLYYNTCCIPVGSNEKIRSDVRLCFHNTITQFRCLTGLHLLINKQAAVFHNVSLAIKWLLHPFQGNLTCTLNAGDGHTIDPYMPEE